MNADYAPMPPNPNPYKTYFFKACKFGFHWTPRCCVAYYTGLHGLGYAYKNGIMCRIQFKAIEILYPRIGYAGLGAAMPRIDWYAACAVQSLCFIIGGILYDIVERVILFLFDLLFLQRPVDTLSNANIEVLV